MNADRWEATLYEYPDEYEIEAGHVNYDLAIDGVNGWFYDVDTDRARSDVIEAALAVANAPLMVARVNTLRRALAALDPTLNEPS